MPKSVISDTKSRQPRPLLPYPFPAHYRTLCEVRGDGRKEKDYLAKRKGRTLLKVTVCLGKFWPTRAAISQTIRNASTINQRRAQSSDYRSWSSLSSLSLSSSSGAVTNLTVTHLTNNSHGQRFKNLWVTQLATQTIGTAHLSDFRFPETRPESQDPRPQSPEPRSQTHQVGGHPIPDTYIILDGIPKSQSSQYLTLQPTVIEDRQWKCIKKSKSFWIFWQFFGEASN